MYDQDQHSFCSEFSIVEKTIDVVAEISGETETIRIEAHRNEPAGRYSTSSFIQEHITVQPSYPMSNGEYDRKPEDMIVWRKYDLPWIDRGNAEDAIRQALGFLKEKVSS